MSIKHVNPLLVCIADKKIVRDSISKSVVNEPWPLVFQETPDAALETFQENLVSIIIDPLFNTACPSCGAVSNWEDRDDKCECGFRPKKGKNVYNEWGPAKRLTVIILPYHAPKYTVTKLREKGYWALRLKKENTVLDLPKVIKLALKTLSKFYRLQ